MKTYSSAEDFIEDFGLIGRGPQLAMEMGIRGEGSQVLSRAILDLAITVKHMNREIVDMFNKDDPSGPVKVYEKYDKILFSLPYILTHPLYRDISDRFPVHYWTMF
ncbi:MAG: hypothetical protein ACO395_09560 [Pontimonas sp.]